MSGSSVTPASRAPSRSRLLWPLLGGLGFVLVLAVVYQAVWSAGFIWDDESHLTENPCIIGPLGLREVWTSASANYFPLVLTHLWVQHAIWGLQPLPYHLASLLLHALSAFLLARVLLRLRVPGAWLGAALWAFHPIAVESVAWISELKNTQSAVFYLLAALAYLRWLDATEPGARRRAYALTVLSFAAALLSKPSTVMLPAALLLCAYARDRRTSWRNVAWLLPLFALAALASGWTVWEQKYHSFAAGPEWALTPLQRAAIAGKAVWFYLGKLAWPEPLMFVYPRWQPAADPLALLPLLGAIALPLALAALRHPVARAAIWAYGYFVLLLFPVLGFFDVYYFRYSFVADHFQYLASMGPLALAGAGIVTVGRHVAGFGRAAVVVATALVLIMLATLTWRHAWTFSTPTTLWRATQERNPNCWIAESILGNDARDAGRLDDALQMHRHALALDPYAHEAYYNLGLTLVKLGRTEEAIAQYQRALAIKPNFHEAEHNLGVALATAGRPAEAIPHYRQALRFKPLAESHYMLALSLTLTGAGDEAIAHYQQALQLRPNYRSVHYALGRTYELLERHREAAAEFRAELGLDATSFPARVHLAAAQYRLGDARAAGREYETALRLEPDHADAQCDYAAVLAATGDIARAVEHYQAAVRLEPDLAAAHHNLAVHLQALGRSAESAAHAAIARRLQPNLPALPSR
ncbi:tetratricopeptide repeat protein [Opitutus sp. ER46]|uniref:tetratricopeptide repeat protein n=1 Tax=Opitutus sp. ER46 TaxID=2161864 RepID=UPI000D322A50|nr:tetratricopeptide repeat protein [Opitutus sp. ER46]PTX94326.1 hypothetical protein DB354_11230 [Opitutus sp. ER46]